MRFFPIAATVLYVLAVPILLVTSNVRFLLSDEGYYKRGLREYDAVKTTGISQAELDMAAGELIDYFEDDASSLRIVVHVDGEEVSLFNQRETDHMRDVKSLVRFTYRLNEISLVVVLTYIAAVFIWARDRQVRALAKQTLLGVGAGFAAVGAIGGLAVAVGFDEVWNRFHKVVFRNDLWQLDPDTDRLIQMFPEPFWESATYLVVGLSLLEVAVLVVVSVAYLVVSRGEPQPPTSEPPRATAHRVRARP
ncbi:MAG: TIGR01906 family membrane protein [Chloroflexi bacterium]|nr:TIGR01906 family membrane protein [Chloroflexota bacterium]